MLGADLETAVASIATLMLALLTHLEEQRKIVAGEAGLGDALDESPRRHRPTAGVPLCLLACMFADDAAGEMLRQ
jgi:cytochrome P450